MVKYSLAKDGEKTWLNIWPASCYVTLDVFPSIIDIVQKFSIEAQGIRWFCGTESPVLHYTQGPQTVIVKEWGNMMVRVVDFTNFCTSIDIPHSAADKCIIQLVDEYCPWNEGIYMISPANGKLDVEHTDKEPEIVLDAVKFSRIVGGYTPATILQSLNEIHCPRKMAERFDAIFPSDHFFSHYRF